MSIEISQGLYVLAASEPRISESLSIQIWLEREVALSSIKDKTSPTFPIFNKSPTPSSHVPDIEARGLCCTVGAYTSSLCSTSTLLGRWTKKSWGLHMNLDSDVGKLELSNGGR